MQQIERSNEHNQSVIGDNIVIKKMRLIRRMTRKEAALIFSYSRSSIEKVENGRGKLTPDKVRRFIEGYGFTDENSTVKPRPTGNALLYLGAIQEVQ